MSPFKKYKLVELVGGGSVINWTYPVYFYHVEIKHLEAKGEIGIHIPKRSQPRGYNFDTLKQINKLV